MLRQNGGNGVLRVIVLQQHGQARLHKVGNFGSGIFRQQPCGELCGGVIQQVFDGQGRIHQHPQHAQRGAAQRVGVFVARRNQSDAPNAHQRFQLVRQRNGGCHRAFRQRIAGKARAVMLLDGGGNFGRFAVQKRVVFAHCALQFGELAHHFGDQIGFGKARGAFGSGFVRTQRGGNMSRDALQPFDALGLTADFVVIYDICQFGQAAFQRGFLVLFVEKFRIRQPRAQYAFIAVDDMARVSRFQIGNQQEAVHQPAVCIQKREIFLVLLHGQNQAFLRHGKEVFFKLCL